MVEKEDWKRRVHIDYAAIEVVKLTVSRIKAFEVEHPGALHYATKDYDVKFAEMTEDEKLVAGHKVMTVAGIVGVAVPNENVRKLTVKDIDEARLHSEVDVGSGISSFMKHRQKTDP